MAKLLEDKVNVENDTKKGLTGVILIVEDAADYYSTYVPMLYTLVLEQTRILIEDVSSDELYKVLKLRARPKILLATTWEEAMSIYTKYKDSLLGVISDMRFPRNGVLNDMAGYDLIQHITQGAAQSADRASVVRPRKCSICRTAQGELHKQELRDTAAGPEVIYYLLPGVWPFCLPRYQRKTDSCRQVDEGV
ncbi:MAG: hypothetical protein MZV63_54825 [Marinilabiliales bacterium]|nr:hypothetical protein [Marinilabiliales bacterium]